MSPLPQKSAIAMNVALEFTMLGALIHAHSAVGIAAWVCYQSVSAYQSFFIVRAQLRAKKDAAR